MKLSELRQCVAEHVRDLKEQEAILSMPGSVHWDAPSAVLGSLRLTKPEGCAVWMDRMLGECKTAKQLEAAVRKHLAVILEWNPDSYLADLMLETIEDRP